MPRARLGLVLALSSACGSGSAPVGAEPQPVALEQTPKPPPRPAPPDWQPLASVPECDVFVATNPAAAAPALVWRPCAVHPEGCRELVDPKPPDPRFGPAVRVTLIGGMTTQGVHLVVSDEYATPGRSRVWLAPLDRPPFLVFDHPGPAGPCHFASELFGAQEAALILYRSVGEFDAEVMYFAGPLRADPAWLAPAVRVPPLAAGDGGASRLVLDAGTGRLVPGPASLDRDDYALGPAIVRTDRRHVLVGAVGAPPRVLYTAPPGRRIASFHTDGRAFYWAQALHEDALGAKPSDIELWTANVTDDPEHFVARKLCDTELQRYPTLWAPGELNALVTGGGKLTYADTDEAGKARVVVVDIATGARRSWPASVDEGTFATSILFINAEELAFHMYVNHASAYWRVRLDALTPM